MGLADDQHILPRRVATIRATLFGGFQVITPDDNEIIISNRRAQALLAMVCLAPDDFIDRDHLSRLLWPGRFDVQAKASLRQCLLDLGKLLGRLDCDILDVSRSRISSKHGAIQSDLADLEHALSTGDYTKATNLLNIIGTKSLLDQMHFGEGFADWLDGQRRQVEQRLQAAVSKALLELEQRDDLISHANLANAWSLRAAAPDMVAERKLGKTRIAVLPFRSLASPDDNGIFADGVVDELITTLGQLPQMLVAGRTSSFQFRNSDQRATDIAAALNVSHLLEGSVQREGEHIRINASLVDGKTGFESWSYSYDGSLDDIFAARQDVARAITNGLNQALDLQEYVPNARGRGNNREAYGLYLQGRALTIRAIGDGVMENAVNLLEQSLELDPDFAEGWTALAEAEINVTVYTPCTNRLERTEKAAQYARKAIALDPTQGHARIILAFHEWTKNNIVGALDLAFEAYRLEPNNPEVVNRLGSFLLYIGRCKQALPYIEASIDQDPVNGRAYAMLSAVHLNLGNLDKAIAAGKRMSDLGFPSMWLAIAIAASGDHDLAVETYQMTKHLMNTVIFAPVGTSLVTPEAMDAYWLISAKACCSGEEGDRIAYGLVQEMMHATLQDPYDTTIVQTAIWTGNAQMVFKTIGKQITPANFFCLMALWSDFDPINRIRRHPDFMAFAERTGMIAAWEKYGWPDNVPKPESRA